MLERLMHDQLFAFLNINKSITCTQAAFRKQYSTIISLISSTDFWYENIDRSNVNLIICLDLKKVFDTVDHDILLKKLSAYGIRGKAGDWFESYLNNRNSSALWTVSMQSQRRSLWYSPRFLFRPSSFHHLLEWLRKVSSNAIASDDVARLVEDAHPELSNLSE